MLDKELALKLIQGKSWHHDFEIIPGVRTHGAYDPVGLWKQLQLPPDMSGLSLADVGASNGYFSFEARKRGARVVAFDFRHKDNSGFGLAQYVNGLSEIQHHQINVLDITPGQFGQFDIVLALGLLYHVSDPYMALANCAALSRNRLLIESYCIDRQLPERLTSEPIMRFFPDSERFPMQGQPNADRSNFWGFTATCLRRMVEDIGFVVQNSNVREDRVFIDAKRGALEIDATRVESKDTKTRLNIAYGSLPPVPLNGNPDDPKAWTIF
jgi:tRNA (mo5U34)-methyltransferase